MKRVFIPLSDEERQGLIALAREEKRDPRQQAALIIRQSLEHRGLIEPRRLAQVNANAQGVKNGR